MLKETLKYVQENHKFSLDVQTPNFLPSANRELWNNVEVK